MDARGWSSIQRGSARLRLMILLTLALLPVGLLSVMQAREMAAQTRSASERVLLGETIRAAAAQREVIRTAQGQARALGSLLRGAANEPAACDLLLAEFVATAPHVGFAGLVGADGRLLCASDGSRGPVPEGDSARILVDEGHPAQVRPGGAPGFGGLAHIDAALWVIEPVRPSARKSDKPATSPSTTNSTTKPGPELWPDGPTQGAIVLALPPAALVSTDVIPGESVLPVTLVTFDRTGAVLWSTPEPPGTVVGSRDEARWADMPTEPDLAVLIGAPAHAKTLLSAAGDRRAYAVVPVIAGDVTTLGKWPPDSPFAGPLTRQTALGVLLPLLMWALSLVVAYVAVNRLMLTPLGRLRERMQAFTGGARLLPPFRLEGAPTELRHLAESFDAMTTRIVSDETRLEKAVHDQQVLLKEVHHRVKNNLQLIASILNMQIRQHKSPESQGVLRRVQDRVMSLATVHQHLYQTPSLAALRADRLLAEIINRKMSEAGRLMDDVSVQLEMGTVRLYPDQAVPLALLAGEAVTNALSHLGRPPAEGSGDGVAGGAGATGQGGPGRPWLSVALDQADNGQVRLEIANSGGPRLRADQTSYRAGLGLRLIQAFAGQLEGQLTTSPGDEQGSPWRIELSFLAEGFSAEEGGVPSDAPSDAPPDAATVEADANSPQPDGSGAADAPN